MGLQQTGGTSSKTFIEIGYGRLRQKNLNGEKVDENTPSAVKRETKDGTKHSWAIEFGAIVGFVDSIFYRPSENKFPASYELVIRDAGELYQIKLVDDNTITFDFLGKFLNIDLENEIFLAPYDFEDKKTGKTRKGMTVKQNPATKDGQAVNSHFRSYDEASKTWNYSDGYPEPTADTFKPGKEKLRDRYNSDISIFMKDMFDAKILPMFKDKRTVPDQVAYAKPATKKPYSIDSNPNGSDTSELPF